MENKQKPSAMTTQSKTPSTEDSFKEENFVESLTSQVDEENIGDIIQHQKRALERFEKTNEMLSTCCALTERRLDKARKEFTANRDVILEAKNDLESIFRRIRGFKQTLLQKYPIVYDEQAKAVYEQSDRKEDDTDRAGGSN